jgi:hypothetical protein
LLEELRAVIRGEPLAKSPVTAATLVTDENGYRSKPLELQALQRLQAQASKAGKGNSPPVPTPVPAPPELDEAAIEERAGLCADRVPAVYLDAWARLNHEKPARVSDGEWRIALNSGGRFLDDWGSEAAELGWRPGELFNTRAGLIWRLASRNVKAITADRVQLSDGRTVLRMETRGFR